MIILATGEPSEKNFIRNGSRERHIATPFVGTTGAGDYCSLGVGLLFEDGTAQLWGLVLPHTLIQSWRAMKLLEHVEEIHDGTLCYAWYAATPYARRDDSDRARVAELAQHFSPLAFKRLQHATLHTLPTEEELADMLATAREHSIALHDIDPSREPWEILRNFQREQGMLGSLIARGLAFAEQEHKRKAKPARKSKEDVYYSAEEEGYPTLGPVVFASGHPLRIGVHTLFLSLSKALGYGEQHDGRYYMPQQHEALTEQKIKRDMDDEAAIRLSEDGELLYPPGHHRHREERGQER